MLRASTMRPQMRRVLVCWIRTVYPGDTASIVFGSKSRVGLGGMDMEAKV